jgi:hypothetical protein
MELLAVSVVKESIGGLRDFCIFFNMRLSFKIICDGEAQKFCLGDNLNFFVIDKNGIGISLRS